MISSMKVLAFATFVGVGAALLTSCSSTEPANANPAACVQEGAPEGSRVLVFSRTAGYRHDSIPAGVAAVRSLGEEYGLAVDETADPSWFSDDRLDAYSAVVFMSTTGDLLNGSQEAAFERYIQGGGG